jgi:hypothetical protein
MAFVVGGCVNGRHILSLAGASTMRSTSNLTVADGFKFGCGLILAGVAFYFILIIVAALAILVVILFNVNLPIGIPGPIN